MRFLLRFRGVFPGYAIVICSIASARWWSLIVCGFIFFGGWISNLNPLILGRFFSTSRRWALLCSHTDRYTPKIGPRGSSNRSGCTFQHLLAFRRDRSLLDFYQGSQAIGKSWVLHADHTLFFCPLLLQEPKSLFAVTHGEVNWDEG